MPYKTKAELERENWMTLPETVAHICSADKCDEKTARRELVKALAEGLRPLGPLEWEKERGDRQWPFGTSSITTPTDTPPIGSRWLGAKIRWKTGRVRDDWGEYKPGQLRVLLILRHNVVRNWPRPRPGAMSWPKPPKKSANVVGRPSALKEVRDELSKMRKENWDMSRPYKALAADVARRRGKKLDAERGWSQRTIEGHVSDCIDGKRNLRK